MRRYKDYVSELDKAIFQIALEQTRGNESAIARELGLARGTVRTKLKKLELSVWDYRGDKNE